MVVVVVVVIVVVVVEVVVVVTFTEMDLDLKVPPLGQKHFETYKTPLSFFIIVRFYCTILASHTKLRYFDFLYVKGYSINPHSKHGSSVVRR